MDKAHKATDKRLEAMEREIAAIYREAQKGISDKAAAYFEQFKRLDEDKKALVADGKLSEDEYLQWRKNKILYSKRFVTLQGQITGELARVNQTAAAYINDQLPDVYALNYNYVGKGVQRAVKGYSFTLIDANTVKRLATKTDGLLPKRKVDVPKDKLWNAKKMRTQVLQGILQGESMDKIADRMQTVTDMNGVSAIRNARTMVTGAENAGRIDMMHRAAADGVIMRKRWIATTDSRTRDWHRDLDGKESDIDEPFHNDFGDIMFPGDPTADGANVYNCRCALGYRVVGFEKAQVQKTVAKSEYNAETIDHQYKEIEAMNEYDYFSAEQEKFRLDSIREMAGYDDMEAMKALDALCGTSAEYRGIGDNVPTGWFSGADTKIRLAKDGEFFDKAKTIDAYIERSPKYKGSIYRGLSLDDETISGFTVGGTFKENGNLSSWTSDSSVASMFAEGRSEELGNKPVIFRTKDPKHGTPAAHLSIFGSDESEVLVSNMKDSEYIIEAVTEESGMVIVDMILKGG